MFILIAATLSALDAVCDSDAEDQMYLRKIFANGPSGYEHLRKWFETPMTYRYPKLLKIIRASKRQVKIVKMYLLFLRVCKLGIICLRGVAVESVNKIVVCCCCLHVLCGLLNLDFNWFFILLSR